MKTVILVVIAMLFLGCEPAKEVEHKKMQLDYNTPSDGRFELEKVQSFVDGDSYSRTRSIFILTDKQTGKEYVGVSGVGISEMGSHLSGKTTVSDER